MKICWVVSIKKNKDGIFQPVHLIDHNTVIDKDLFRLSISREMAEKRIPIQAPDTGFLTEHSSILEKVTDKEAAEKKFDAYMSKHKKAKKEIEKKIEEETELVRDVMEVAKKVTLEKIKDSELKKTKKKSKEESKKKPKSVTKEVIK